MFHGIDWDGPLPDGDDLELVEVPTIPVPLKEDDLWELHHTVCSTAPSNEYGLDLHNRCLQFVQSKFSFSLL